MEYFAVNFSDRDKVEDLMNKNHIYYEDVDDYKILSDYDNILENASIDDLIRELKTHKNLYFGDLLPLCAGDRDLKKEMLISLLDIGRFPADEAVLEEVKKIIQY